jgi:hypothetical protein
LRQLILQLNCPHISSIVLNLKFWRDLLKYFFELKSKTTEHLQGDSIIWFNSLLKIEGKTFFYKELHDKGLSATWEAMKSSLCASSPQSKQLRKTYY